MAASSVHIDFRLRPLREIAPWHDADGSHPSLGWFGLTDGWYWIAVGEVELFRYSRAVVDKWAQEAADEPWFVQMGGLPFVDYQVAQLWNDLLGFLPDVLAPVPPPLAFALASGAWTKWEREAEVAVREALPEREASNLLYDAMRWLGKREVDSAYLLAGPAIRCWSDGAQVHVQWDNRGRMLDGLPRREATTGHHTLSPAAFHDAIGDFNARFLRRMADRVAIAQGEWARPEVMLAPHLAETHLAKTRWAQGRKGAWQPGRHRSRMTGIRHLPALPASKHSLASPPAPHGDYRSQPHLFVSSGFQSPCLDNGDHRVAHTSRLIQQPSVSEPPLGNHRLSFLFIRHLNAFVKTLDR